MKLTNLQAVTFINIVGELQKKRIPTAMSFALLSNVNVIMNQVKAYEDVRKTIVTNDNTISQELVDLLNETVEHNLKTIKFSDLETIDRNPKYDSFTVSELSAIMFMVEDETTKDTVEAKEA